MQPPEMETIEIELRDGVALVFLARPEKLNAVNQVMFEEIGTAADYVRDDPAVKVAVISGRGRAFSAGLDLAMAESLVGVDLTEFRMMVRRMQRNFRAWELIEKPVLASVNGPAFGAGTELVLACDMILASSAAVFGLLEVNLGLVTDLGATQRLPRFIGIHRAKELIMTGKKIDAAEAERIGLVNAVYPPDRLEEETMALANHLKSLSPVAVGLCKLAIDRSRGGSTESGLEYEAQSQTIALAYMMEMAKKARENGAGS